MKPLSDRDGMTLIELLVVIVAMGIVVAGAMRLFVSSNNSYSLQSSNTEMHQNGKFAFQHLRNTLEEAGAGLPLQLTVLNLPVSGSVQIMTNRKGGITELPAAVGGTRPKIAVDSAELFVTTSNTVNYVPPDQSAIHTVSLDSVRTAEPDSLYLSSQPVGNLAAGGFVCAPIVNESYFLDNTNLCLNSASNVLAENIESLVVKVLEVSGGSLSEVTSDFWNKRVFFSLVLIAGNGRTGTMRQTSTFSDTVRFQNPL